MVFEITFTLEMWEAIVNGVNQMLTEAEFWLSPEELYLSQLDPSKAAMVNIKIPKKDFVNYKVTKNERLTLNTEMLTKTLKRLAKTTEVTVKSGASKSTVIIEAKFEGKDKSFEIANFVGDQEEPSKFPSLPADADIELTTVAFKDAFDDVKIGTQGLSFVVEEDKIVINASTGDDIANHTTTIYKTEGLVENIIDMQVTNPIKKTQFANHYIEMIIKSISTKSVKLELTSVKPLVARTWISENGSIAWMIAPRVERR